MCGDDAGFRRRIPTDSALFVGRENELARLANLLGETRLITLTGVGGVGKTRIALRAAETLAEGFRDGARTVALAGLRDPALVVHAVAAALGVTDHTTRPLADVLAAHLSDRRALLVLDTCEHLLDVVADLTARLLRAAPGLHVLTTSRQPLGVPGERLLVVEPLSADTDAVTLFTERAAAAGFTLDPDHRPAAEEICRRLEGLPLAVELAAGRLRTQTPAEVLERLDDRFRELTDDRTDGAARDPRHRALRTAVGWSHELCTPAERLLWARLSVFAGDFSLEAAEAVCGGEELEDIDQLIGGLVEKSVLARLAGRDRYRMLDTIRAYGGDWLRALGEETDQRVRHRDWCLELAETGESQWWGPGQADVFRHTAGEHEQLRAALDFCLTTPGHEQVGLRLAGALWFYWAGCGLLGEGRYWLDRTLALDPIRTPDRAKALWVCGYVAVLQGDTESAVRLLEECRAQALRTGDDRALAYAVHRLGCARLINDEHAAAEPLFEDALHRYAELAELNSNVVMARVELAMSVAFQGRLAAAVNLCEEARYICEVYGERWTKAYALYVLSFAELSAGRLPEATALARECLRVNHEFRDLVGLVLPLELLALIAALEGEGRRAAALQGAASGIWRRVGVPLFGSAYFNHPHERGVRLARELLGDRGYTDAAREGAALCLDDAVGVALGEPRLPEVPRQDGRRSQPAL
ncbi:putative HTH-type transcriptional regulator [Streptomyces sp. RB5]|uniref:Putative HTH-type transcriptional regulator n=1 Tax=Streptomyces smaragdinus TaxID=2585196 RepID=A0A7K0CLQ9_9ACTN|nr:NB-ARC domain-containing protein [Streptomyces smaragdinus]MQY13694.1 putative HTH-type transcriptional regulator [Streptomyces smaragdinus]